MFGRYRGLADKLISLGMNKSWAIVLQDMLANLYQLLDHRGPVKIRSSFQDDTLELANYKGHGAAGEVSGNALHVTKGHGVTGDPKLTGTLEGGLIPPDLWHNYWRSTHDNYHQFNYPVSCMDDLRIFDLIKYGLPSMGSTVVRCQFEAPFSGQPGDVKYARKIDKHCRIIPGLPPFAVTDVLGIAGTWAKCAKGNPTGRAIYMSDLAPDGKDDCQTRDDIGGWELESYYPDLSDFDSCTAEFVTDVSCVNGRTVVCTQTIDFSTPVRLGPSDCGGSVGSS